MHVAGGRIKEIVAPERLRELPGFGLATNDEIAVGPCGLGASLHVENEAVNLLRLEPRRAVDADRLVVELGDALVAGGRIEQALSLECC